MQARYASTEKYVKSVYVKLTRRTKVTWKDDVWFSAVWKKKGDAKYGFQSGSSNTCYTNIFHASFSHLIQEAAELMSEK